MRTEQLEVPGAHPAFAGHFPGRPLVPGSLLLELILSAWGKPSARIGSVKFLYPVRPGDTLDLDFSRAGPGSMIRFRCQRDGQPVCTGTLLAGRGDLRSRRAVMSDWSNQRERGSAASLRLVRWIALHLGRWPVRMLLYPITLYFLLSARSARRISRGYLSRVLGRPARIWDVARHMHSFASVTLDRVYLLRGRRDRLEIRLHGQELVDQRLASGQGFLLLGSHLGSFEVLRALAIDEVRMPIKILMYPEHNRVITELLHALNPEFADAVISLAGPQPLLAVKESLDAGCAVGLLGDRHQPGEATLCCAFLGATARFPSGPMSLAAVTGAPVILCFGLYRGGNRYDVHFELLVERLDAGPRSGREATLHYWVQRYADRLAHYTRSAPFNWFNFFDFWDDDQDLRSR